MDSPLEHVYRRTERLHLFCLQGSQPHASPLGEDIAPLAEIHSASWYLQRSRSSTSLAIEDHRYLLPHLSSLRMRSWLSIVYERGHLVLFPYQEVFTGCI